MRGKRFLAVLTAVTMVMAMSITVFAENDNPGSSEGAGSSEGHVEKKLTNVIIPTVPTGATSPFKYTMDPERLISTTSNAKYEDVVYPSGAADKGVYFNNGEGTDANVGKTVYASSSLATKVTNKSSHDIALTVKAEAVASEGGTDIPLTKQADLADATEASLYLGLDVGGTKKEVLSDAAASTTVTLAGKPANFKIAVDAETNNYVYREMTLEEWKTIDGNGSKTLDDFNADWNNTTFSLEGETTTGKAITSATTAPKIKVTWSWVDPTENSITEASVSGTNNVIHYVAQTGVVVDKVVLHYDGKELVLTAGTHYTVNADAKTITIVAKVLSGNVGNTLDVSLKNADGNTVANKTINIVE